MSLLQNILDTKLLCYYFTIVASLSLNSSHTFILFTLITKISIYVLHTYLIIISYYYIPLIHRHYHYFPMLGSTIGSNETITTYYSSPQLGDVYPLMSMIKHNIWYSTISTFKTFIISNEPSSIRNIIGVYFYCGFGNISGFNIIEN